MRKSGKSVFWNARTNVKQLKKIAKFVRRQNSIRKAQTFLFMETNNKTTKPRQFQIMVEFINNNTQLEKGHLKTPNARQSANALWQALTDELNASGPPIREAAAWKKVWADFKVHTKQKLRRNKNDIGGTGGGPSKFNPLSPLKEQVVKLLNMEDSVNGLQGALSFGTTTGSAPEQSDADMVAMKQLDEVPIQDLLTEVMLHSKVPKNVRSQSCEIEKRNLTKQKLELKKGC